MWDGKDGSRVIDTDLVTDDSSMSDIILPYVENHYPLFEHAHEYLTYHMEHSSCDVHAGRLLSIDFNDFLFNSGPASLMWYYMMHYSVDMRMKISRQLLEFCRKMQDSWWSIRVITGVAEQLDDDNFDGWFFRLNEMSANDGTTSEDGTMQQKRIDKPGET